MLEHREQPARLAELTINMDADQIERVEQSSASDGFLIALRASASSACRTTTCSLQNRRLENDIQRDLTPGSDRLRPL